MYKNQNKNFSRRTLYPYFCRHLEDGMGELWHQYRDIWAPPTPRGADHTLTFWLHLSGSVVPMSTIDWWNMSFQLSRFSEIRGLKYFRFNWKFAEHHCKLPSHFGRSMGKPSDPSKCWPRVRIWYFEWFYGRKILQPPWLSYALAKFQAFWSSLTRSTRLIVGFANATKTSQIHAYSAEIDHVCTDFPRVLAGISEGSSRATEHA